MRISSITLASENTEAMVNFYNAVLDCNLSARAGRFTLYEGDLGGIRLLICPNEIANVVAEQSRHQLRIDVDDLPRVKDRVVPAGGRVADSVSTSEYDAITVYDPDGNSLEIVG